MKLFQKNTDVIDYGATLHEWPKKIWSLQEIPEVYRPCLNSWLDQGMPLEALVWVPPKPYIKNSFEYMAARHNGRILLLFPQEGQPMTQIEISPSQVLYVRSLEYMLNCQLQIFYQEEQDIKKAVLPYNKTTQAMFLPYLNCALSLPENFSCVPLMEKNPRPEHLLHEAHALYTYSEDAFRMGEKILSYQWGTSYLITKGFLFPKKNKVSYLLCEMEKGWCLIEYGQDYHETTFLPKSHGHIQWEEDSRLLRLFIMTKEKQQLVKELLYAVRNQGSWGP